MEADQNTTNINEEKKILPTETLIICEIMFYVLANRSVNKKKSIAENSICSQAVIDRN
jgi:hypothetical protein